MNNLRTVDYYSDVLATLRQDLPGPVHIAGGAARDSLLGVAIKDIDVFLADANADAAAALLRSKHGYVKVGEWTAYEGFSDPMLARVAKFEKADETIPICLIGLHQDLSARENIGRFDFGLCMIAWEGDKFITTDEFKRDAEAKSFTLYRADNASQFAYSMSRFKKLTADRYDGWTLAVPARFEALVREHSFRTSWYEDWHEDGAHYGYESRGQTLHPKTR